MSTLVSTSPGRQEAYEDGRATSNDLFKTGFSPPSGPNPGVIPSSHCGGALDGFALTIGLPNMICTPSPTNNLSRSTRPSLPPTPKSTPTPAAAEDPAPSASCVPTSPLDAFGRSCPGSPFRKVDTRPNHCAKDLVLRSYMRSLPPVKRTFLFEKGDHRKAPPQVVSLLGQSVSSILNWTMGLRGYVLKIRSPT
ncbi:hypothetical protein NMY22_g4732 [Coprinellus aureogranulatus]|nr:hypothetical protein NMY22_g4732 [Coprinellus aureogranulatus]